ncbi:MAG: serine/threonine protein kinase [bacterium]|nr:serine/threonine protein kinase [bacterium]
MSSSPYFDPQLQELVAIALERRDQGQEVNLEELCRERPDLLPFVHELSAAEPDEVLAVRLHSQPGGYTGVLLDGRFLLGRRLGAGAMGVVFQAEDLKLHRQVAVKILRPAVLGTEEASQRFEREAKVMASLKHPAIAAVYDQGLTAEGDFYLVLELHEGLPLDRLLELALEVSEPNLREDSQWISEALKGEVLRERKSLRVMVAWTAEIASGLRSAHEQGILHRDVKPSNIFIRRDGQPVLLDFGIASDEQWGRITATDMPLGTPAFMAPESLRTGASRSSQLDVYGLSATLYNMLTLHQPFSGTPSQILTSLAFQEPVPAAKLCPDLPHDLRAILDQGMARLQRDRYGSMEELESDLRAFLDHAPVMARPISRARRWFRRMRRSAALKGGAAASLLGIALLFAAGWQSDRAEADRADRASAYKEVYAQFPLNLTLLNFENRKATSEQERLHHARIFDRAAELCNDPVPTMLLRAAFRLDHGDPVGARQDMRVVARSVDTPYVRAMADAFDKLPTSASSASDLDLSGLPEPEQPMDKYIAAYNCLRRQEYAGLQDWLNTPDLDEFVPALELRQLLELAGLEELEGPNLIAAAEDAYDSIIRLEERIGVRTARIANSAAYCLLHLGRFEDSLECAVEGIKLSPWSHVLRVNGGRTAYRLGKAEQAEKMLRRAIELRPMEVKAHLTLGLVLVLASESKPSDASALLSEAQRVLERAPVGKSKKYMGWQKANLAEVWLARVHHALEKDDLVTARKAAKHCLKLSKLARKKIDEPLRPRDVIAQSVLDGDLDVVKFDVRLYLLEQGPLLPDRLKKTLEQMPAELTEPQVVSLKRALRRLNDALPELRAF